MSPFIRWVKFNLVGAIGVAVQLCALAALARVVPRHYLLATTAAIELTIVHNFIWHMNLTWRDRRVNAKPFSQLVRFHLSNGAISLIGNLVLTRFFKEELRLPLLAANAIAIACCSVMNFLASDRWAFADRRALSSDWRYAKSPEPSE